MRRLFQIAILAAGLDYVSKMLILNVVQLPLVGRIEMFPPFLNFHMAWNYGVNFGLFAHDSPWTRWVLIAIAVGVSVFIAYWAWKERFGPWEQVFAGLLIGGALGNAYDRIRYGAVVDFLNMSCCGFKTHMHSMLPTFLFSWAPLVWQFSPNRKKTDDRAVALRYC